MWLHRNENNNCSPVLIWGKKMTFILHCKYFTFTIRWKAFKSWNSRILRSLQNQRWFHWRLFLTLARLSFYSGWVGLRRSMFKDLITAWADLKGSSGEYIQMARWSVNKNDSHWIKLTSRIAHSPPYQGILH